MDVIRDKNLVKLKGTKRRDRHKIIFLWIKSKKTGQKSVPTGKLCSSRLLEIKQKGKLDDRMRCRRDSVFKLPHPHLQLPWLEAVMVGKDWVVSKVEMQWNMSFVQVYSSWISFTYIVKVIKVHVIYNISHYFSYTLLYCIFINCTVHVTDTFCFYSAFLPSFSFVFQMTVC